MTNPRERETVGMSTKTGKSSTDLDVFILDYEEKELMLGLRLAACPTDRGSERRRGFLETIDLTLGCSRIDQCGGDRSSDSSNDEISDVGKPPAVKVQVIGWLPVRVFRWKALKSCTYVKVAIDDAPYLRKVDLDTYGGYQQLLTIMLHYPIYPNEKRLVDPVNGTEYVPTYEDRDGDWMLVGDAPWKWLEMRICQNR